MPVTPTIQAFLDQVRSTTSLGTGSLISALDDFKDTIVELAEGGTLEVQDDAAIITPAAQIMNFTGPGVIVTDVAGVATVAVSGGAGGSLNFQEEGVAVVSSVTLNAVGIGATITDVAGVATLTVPGTAYQEEGGAVVSSMTLNFVGASVTVTDVAGVATVTIVSTVAWQEEGAAVVSSGTLNAVGAGATLTDVAGVATLTIPGELPVFAATQEQTSGTPGGNSAAATQNVRDLNTVKKNTISGASLAASQVTLPAGDYRVRAWQQGHRVSTFQSRVRDTTGVATLVNGLSGFSDSGTDGSGTPTLLDGYFTIGVSSVLELQMFTADAETNGMGTAASSGDIETFAYIVFEKLD